MKYVINENTYFVKKIGNEIEATEKEKTIKLEQNIAAILNETCKYYGANYEGRKIGAKYLLHQESKVPIIVNEKKNFIIFPLNGDRNRNNIWFVYNNILSYKRVRNYVEITFKNQEKVIFLISYNIFKNQMAKCHQLLSIILLRS